MSRKKNTVTLSRFREEKGDNDEGERILYLMGTKGMTNAMMMMQMISVQIVFVQEKNIQRVHEVTRAICSYGQHLYVVNVSSFVHEKMKIKPYILNVWLYL